MKRGGQECEPAEGDLLITRAEEEGTFSQPRCLGELDTEELKTLRDTAAAELARRSSR